MLSCSLAVGEEGFIKGWEEETLNMSKAVTYRAETGTFKVERTGVYFLYCQVQGYSDLKWAEGCFSRVLMFPQLQNSKFQVPIPNQFQFQFDHWPFCLPYAGIRLHNVPHDGHHVGLCHIGQYGLYPSNRTCKTNMLSQEHYINVASYHVRCMYTEGLMKLNEYWDLGIVYSGE